MKKAVLLTSCAVMVGCSWVPDVGGLVGLGEEERESYIDTRPLPPMQIPEGLNGDSIQDALPVPTIAEQPFLLTNHSPFEAVRYTARWARTTLRRWPDSAETIPPESACCSKA